MQLLPCTIGEKVAFVCALFQPVLVSVGVWWFSSDGSAKCEEEVYAHGETEMITNPVLLAGLKLLVHKPGLSSLALLFGLLCSCVLCLHYNELKFEPLALGPFDTRLKRVHDMLSHDFPENLLSTTKGIVMIWSEEGNDITKEGHLSKTQGEIDKSFADLMKNKDGCSSLKWQSYNPYMPPIMSKNFLSTSKDAAIVEITLQDELIGFSIGQRIECYVHVREALSAINQKFGGLNVVMASKNAIVDPSMDLGTEETARHMIISAPFMALLLMCGVGTIYRAMTPFIVFICGLVGMRASLVLIKWVYRDLNFTGPDSMVQFVMLALSFDYALFFWTRFTSERMKAPEPDMLQRAVLTTLTTSGYVIMLSMLVLVVAYTITLVYPNHNNVGCLGLTYQFIFGCGLVGFYSMAIPAVLTLNFPSLFDESDEEGLQKTVSDYVRKNFTVRPWWIKKISEPITRLPWALAVPLGIFCLLVPLALLTRSIVMDYDVMYVSNLVPEYHANQVYAKHFDEGRLNPTVVLLEAVPLHGITHPTPATPWERQDNTLTKEFGQASCRFVQSVFEATRGKDYEIEASDAHGLWWERDKCLDTPIAGIQRDTMLSKDGQAQVMLFYSSVKDQAAEAMTRHLWKVEKEMPQTFISKGKHYKLQTTFLTPTADSMLVEQGYRNLFPYVMGITIVLTCCLVGYCFSSVFLSVKLLFTVFIPIIAEYGLLVAIYQKGWFASLGFDTVGGFPWPMFYTTPGLLFALAIDYDMFLFARVYERRLDGYDNRSAVRIALEETGPTITLAGSLMMVAFFFIWLNTISMISLIGALYFIGVAMDTFIVRMWIAPACLCMYEQMNYWPVQMPPATKDYASYERNPTRCSVICGDLSGDISGYK